MTLIKNNLNRFISNKVLKTNRKYSLIIGETPSSGADHLNFGIKFIKN